MRTRSRALAAVGLLALAAAWWVFAPTAVGGRATYVVTHGTSMLPRFHSGDLAIVLPAETYSVGDVAAYHSPLLDTTVLHRIVDRDGTGLVFQGDSNSWLDPERPTADEIIGTPAVRIPNGGKVLDWLHTPTTAATLASGLVLVGASGRRRRRRQARAGGSSVRHITGPTVSNGVLVGVTAVALGLTGIAVAAWLTPTGESATTQVQWTEEVTFDYRASVAESAVYPDGKVRSGEPIFRRLVDELKLKASWSLATQASYEVRGTAQLVGTLYSPTGWSRTVELGPARDFTGDETTVPGRLDLSKLDRLAGRMATLTGLPADPYSLDLQADVDLHGQLAGQPLDDVSADPTVTLSVSPATVLPGSTEGAADPSAGREQLSATASRTVSSTQVEPAQWNILSLQVPVTTARTVGVVGAGLAAAVLLLLLLVRPRNSEDPRRIAARYGRSIVEVSTVSVADARTTIDVTSIEALARIAQRYDRLILHQAGSVDTYIVDDEATVYRYQPRAAPHPASGEGRVRTRDGDQASAGAG